MTHDDGFGYNGRVNKRRDQIVSFGGVIALALALPLLLRGINYANRLLIGAEASGRLASISVETDHPLGPMPQPWRALAQGGEELETFLDSTAPQISAIKPNYIRIDHIYDGFNVVSRSGNSLVFDWTQLDLLVDKIRSTGATPFFSLSYTPLALTTGDVIDEPTDYNEWALVVQKTIEHYSGELGLENVYYEVWNEPDLFGKWTINGRKDYRKLYFYSSKGATAARNVRDFKLGGPATTGLYKNWLDKFFPYVLENNLRLDFFSWHRYDLDIDKYAEDVANIDLWIDSHPYFSHVEKIVSEMGPSSDKEQANNSSVGAAHLIAASREFLYRIRYGFNFSIKDGAGNDNGWGIIGNSGNTKPRYQALQLLNLLGDQRLSVTGEGTWVKALTAQKGTTYQALVVNYDYRSTHHEVVPVNFLNITPGQYMLRQTSLNGQTTSQEIATTEAILQHILPLTPNSAVLLELVPNQP
jgi:hypothetical protein